MKIYTRTGDAGTTALVGGSRVSKDSPRLNAYGTIDELNSHLGLLAATPGVDAPSIDFIQSIQNRLFNLGAYLAAPAGGGIVTLSNRREPPPPSSRAPRGRVN